MITYTNLLQLQTKLHIRYDWANVKRITTQTGLASFNLVNKHATDNKFSAKANFRLNYEFISSNKVIFYFLKSLKIPDTTFLKFGTRLTEKV